MTSPLLVVEQPFGASTIELAAADNHGVRVQGVPAADPEAFAEAARHADGVIVQFLRLDAQMLAANNWKVVGRYGIGVDNVDVEAATELGIAVINVPDYCIEEVAQHAVALIYAGWRGLRTANRLVLDGKWSKWAEIGNVGRMSDSTLGLVGLGRIGTQVARLLQPAFGRILVHDPFSVDDLPGTQRADLDGLLAESHVVSLHCPLTSDTRGLMNAERLAAMRIEAILVNVSRGELIDVAALPAALDAGRPGQALLDVLPAEPPPNDMAVLHDPRVVITPHVAWLSTDSITELRSKVADRCAAYLTGGDGVSVVNRAALAARQ